MIKGVLLSVALLTLLSFPSVSQEDNEASAIFAEMGAKIRSARSIDLTVVAINEEYASKVNTLRRRKIRSHLLLDGERSHFVLDEWWSVNEAGIARSLKCDEQKEFVSDGTSLRFSWPELSSTPLVWNDQPLPKEWNSSLLRGIINIGTGRGLTSRFSGRRQVVTEEVGLPVGFKLRGREKLGEREAAVIEYSIDQPDQYNRSLREIHKVAVWIDRNTSLPLRREVRLKSDSFEYLIVETFESIALDGNCPPQSFELPKDPTPTIQSQPATELEIITKIEVALLRFEADDPEAREKAEGELVRLGNPAIPKLEARLNSSDPETRGRFAATIDRIYRTDPLFLVRLPDRRTSSHLVDVPLNRALNEVFRPFAVAPRLRPGSSSEISKRLITLNLEHASYWQAVQKVCGASKLGFSAGEHDDPPEFYSKEDPEGAYSQEQGPLVAIATAHHEPARKDQEGETIRLKVHLFIEPGWRPIAARLKVSSVKNKEGNEIIRAFGGEESAEREVEFKQRLQSCPELALAELEGQFSRVPEDVRLTVRGTARVTVVSQVESAVFRIDQFRGDEQRALGEMRIRMTNLSSDETGVTYYDGCKGPQGWRPPEGRPYSKEIWIIASDNEGHSKFMGTRGYTTLGGGGGGVSCRFPSPATRVAYVRPIETEVLEIPYMIEGIKITRD